MRSKFNLAIDVILYIRTDSQNCLKRLNERGRCEEANISLDDLMILEKKHDEWLYNLKSLKGSICYKIPEVFIIDGNQDQQCVQKQVNDVMETIESSEFMNFY
jgi:deoxyadenosine/deoxycytidine kinase